MAAQEGSTPAPDTALDEVTRQRVADLSLASSPTASTEQPQGVPSSASPAAPGPSADPATAQQPALSPTVPAAAQSPASPPSSAPSPSASTSPASSAAHPPPLYPRASAPPASGAPVRRAPAPGAGGALKAGVRGAVPGSAGPLKMPPSLAAKMAAMTSRSSSSGATNPLPSLRTSTAAAAASSSSTGSGTAHRPPPRPPTGPNSAPGAAAPPAAGRPTGALSGAGARAPTGMAARRRGPGAGLTLSQMGASADADAAAPGPGPGPGAASPAQPGRTGMAARRGVGMRLPGSGDASASSAGGVGGDGGGSGARTPNGGPRSPGQQQGGTPFSNFRKIVDPSGRLNFAQKAVLHADGVDFSSGASFKIKMDDFELFEELGKGNYGTVQKVLHRPTGVSMALKEIRLELDDAKLKTIVTELDVLHRAVSPWIIEFYGAFFVESCVYLCMEYMNAGSLDFFAGCAMPEPVLAKITLSVVEGLRFLKDQLKIMHRDIKPTNILLNDKGAVKLCDFGVSGQLDRSLAKTNIGCQSYMAPERIKGESQGAVVSYSAASDVWSLGLTIIEAAVGHYPYPPETYQNVFAQLTAIVHGEAPTLPESYSAKAHEFVELCLRKDATQRPTYQQLLDHPFLSDPALADVDMAGWVAESVEYRKEHPKVSVPALA
ncbi:MAP kinase [Rhodotorula diobovata]|uniref:mitogen-activated protein kinase kinase n=1 Tax=Rhodotorula diobovata TaxID=5288 RepID=A0A5C5G4Q8_9BASI|nr:MAP kinase [Rhodotorula diobovata]